MAKKPTELDDVLGVLNDLAAMTAERFEGMESRFDRLDMQVFKQGEAIKTLQADMNEVKQKVDHIYNVLDAHMKRIEEILEENKVRDHQQERMERWIFQLADAAGVKLRYE